MRARIKINLIYLNLDVYGKILYGEHRKKIKRFVYIIMII